MTPPSRPMRYCAHMAGLGGDGFWLIAEADGKVHGINASGPAARLATLDTYRARSENGEVPVRGPLSALTIPGAVDGWRRAHERFGRLAWDELFDATILYAREGVPVTLFAGHLARAGRANFERLFRDRVNRQELCRNATWPDRCRVRLDIDKVPAGIPFVHPHPRRAPEGDTATSAPRIGTA